MAATVSVLIPTYNRARYLRHAIDSALAQTYSNVEIIVLDDCSQDNTSNVITEYTDHPRVRYIRHHQNLGIAKNWRAGIEAVNGEFFCLLHDDDTFETDFVQRLLVPLLQDETLAVSFCDQWMMGGEGQRLDAQSSEVSRRFRRDVLPSGRLQNFMHSALVDASLPVGASVFRRSIVRPDFINEQAKGGIDMWLFYQILKTGYAAYYVSDRLMNYRQHEAGMSGAMPLYMREGHIFRYRTILADEQCTEIHAVTRRNLIDALSDQGKAFLVRGQRHEARAFLQEVLKHEMSLNTLLAYSLACTGHIGTSVAMKMRDSRS